MKNFFVKSGRPSKDERALADKIQSILLKAEGEGNKELLSSVESQGAVYNLEGLKKLYGIAIKGGNNSNSNNNNIPMGKTNGNNSDNKEEENISSGGDGINAEEVKFEEVPNIAEESQFQQPPVERENAYEKYANTGGNSGGDGVGGNDDNGNGGGGESEGEEGFEEPRDSGDDGGGGGDGDIPEHTKNMSNAKLAKMAGVAYAKLLPILPKKIAKISDAKIEKMERYDELNMNMRLALPDGGQTTVGRYIEGYNASLEEQIVVTPEMQKDFQSALKDMMNEKKVESTPTQVFLGTIAAHLAIIGIAAAEQVATMNRHLKYWKEVHEENKTKSRPKSSQSGTGKGDNNNNPPPKQQTPSPPPPPPSPAPDKPSSNGKSLSHENNDSDIQDENEELSIKPEDAEVK